MTTLIEQPLSAADSAQQFKVDPEVKTLRKKLRTRGATFEQVATAQCMLIGFMTFGFAFIIHLVRAVTSSSINSFLTAIVSGVIAFLFLYFMPRAIRAMSSITHNERYKERKSLKQSLKAAEALSEVIPVFTKEHAEAGLKLDALIDELSLKWKPVDRDRVRSLIFTDMTREFTVHSLIAERGLKTADEVIEALAEMEENKKPLQDGWL